jgi:hypothetical protein
MTEAGAVGRAYFTAWQTVINIMELKQVLLPARAEAQEGSR